MKKIIKALAVIILSLVAVLLILAVAFGAFLVPKDPVIKALPRYDKKEFYSSGGFQDFTDYAKYTYRITESDLAECESLHPVTEADIPTILKYEEHFEGCANNCQDFPSKIYDFDKSAISVGDYFFLYNHYEEPEKAFSFYKLYYFDLDAGILYYFRFNI